MHQVKTSLNLKSTLQQIQGWNLPGLNAIDVSKQIESREHQLWLKPLTQRAPTMEKTIHHSSRISDNATGKRTE
jgi:hypothetical protein